MGKNRKFIDKKQDIIHSFKVVQRSQKDPLVVDENAPQGVLVDTECSDTHVDEIQKYGVYFDDDYDYLQHLRGVKEAIDWEDCDVEVYTIRNEDPKLNKVTHKDIGLILPSSAFESYVEEPTGLLNKAAPLTGPRPELDPDIVAELDKDDIEGDLLSPDDEEALPDNFVSLLNSENNIEGFEEEGEFEDIENWLGNTDNYDDMPPLEASEEDQKYFKEFQLAKNHEHFSDSPEGEEGSDDDCDGDNFSVSDDNEEGDEVHNLPRIPRKRGSRSDAMSRTSASSATVPRTELLKILDAKFERIYNEEYADDQIGALDGEVIEGPFDVDHEVFQAAVRATKKQFETNRLGDLDGDDKSRTVRWIKENMHFRNDLHGEKEEMVTIETKPKLKYDCESILSTLSTTKNRPHLVDDSHLFNRRKPRLTARALKDHDRGEKSSSEDSSEQDCDTKTLLSCISAISIRPKDETPEMRRERKGALKELRRERRKEKKLNKLAFKEELKAQKKVQLGQPQRRIIPTV